LLELAEVLARNKAEQILNRARSDAVFGGPPQESEMVGITEQISDCRDPKDNKFLELAVCGDADVLVTGDDDLLLLESVSRNCCLERQEISSAHSAPTALAALIPAPLDTLPFK